MPPPSSENDLKRRARRRLVGAVALTLLAVIVLPLLLEDEPPPASSLSVHMAPSPEPAQGGQGQPGASDAPEILAEPTPPPPVPPVVAPAKPPVEHEPARKAEPERAAVVKPAPKVPEPPKAVVKPPESTRPAVTPAQPPQKAASEAFVVQLAALADSGKARALQARAAQAGLPAYTDKVGALTRVRVGPYASREAAVAAAVKLAENDMAGQVLTK